MWKGEAPEVRAAYHQKAIEIKAHLMALYPNYRYSPRKSSQIRRRAPRRVINRPLFQHNAHKSPVENNLKAGLVPTSQITRRIPGAQQFLPPVETPGWNPCHLVPGVTPESLAAAAATPVEGAPAAEANADPTLAAIDELIDNWDIEAEIAQIMSEI